VPDGVELERSDAEDDVAELAVPAQERPRPGGELAERERLHEVVVGAVVEPADPVLDLAARGQHQDPRRRRPVAALLGAERAADLAPPEPGQAEVEADQVVRVDARLDEGLVAGVRDVDGVPLAPQPGRDSVGQVLLVLDDEHAHGSPMVLLRFIPA
jgi:hypothetical protein